MSAENKFLIAALKLAERGLSVLPCWWVEQGPGPEDFSEGVATWDIH